MNRKTLFIAMAMSIPVLMAVGCGSMNENRVLADQPEDIGTMETPVPVTQEPVRQPEVDIADAVFAEVEAQPVSEEVAPVTETVAESDPVQPEYTTFYFATDESKIAQEDFDKLMVHAEYLKANPGVSLRLVGHTDQSGGSEYNRWLAKQRAEAVAGVLIDYGVSAKQIKIESMGEDQPVAGLEHAIADRRVELEYLGETRFLEANRF